MLDKSQVRNVIHQSIERVNELRLDEHAVSKDDSTVLIGETSQLDSMGFVNFVVALEETAAKELKMSINLAEELNAPGQALPETITVGGLVEFLFVLVQSRTPPPAPVPKAE